MALLSARSWSDWVAEYARAHQHPVNRICHTIGIPMVVLSFVALVGALFVPSLWLAAVGLFKDLRFLFVGVRWWLEKTQGRV
jgi:hypothetical protein